MMLLTSILLPALAAAAEVLPPPRWTAGVAFAFDNSDSRFFYVHPKVDLGIGARHALARHVTLGGDAFVVGSMPEAPRAQGVVELHLPEGLDGEYLGLWAGSRFVIERPASTTRARPPGTLDPWPYAALVVGSRPVLRGGWSLNIALGVTWSPRHLGPGISPIAGVPIAQFDVGHTIGPRDAAPTRRRARGVAAFGVIGGLSLVTALAVGAATFDLGLGG